MTYFTLGTVFNRTWSANTPLPVVKLPAAFESVSLEARNVAPSVTAAIATFVVHDSHAGGVDAALRAPHWTTHVRTGRHWRHVPPEITKAEALAAAQEELHHQAERWLAKHLGGVFGKKPSGYRTPGGTIGRRRGGLLGGAVPSMNLLLFDQADPVNFARTGEPQGTTGYLHALGLLGIRNYACDQKECLVLSTRSGWRYGNYLSRTYQTLAANRAQLFAPGNSVNRGWDTVAIAGSDLEDLFVPWALSELVRGQQARLAQLRDVMERGSRRWHSQNLKWLRQELVASALDVGMACRELSVVAREQRTIVPYPEFTTANPRIGSHRYVATLWKSISEDTEKLLDDERDLRELLGTVGALNSAITNFGLQILVIVLTVVSLAATALGVYAAFKALH